MNPRVKAVTAAKPYLLEIEFTNGDSGVYDCNPLLDFGVFKELREFTYFRQAKVVNGTVAWPHDQDICPDTLYLDSKKQRSPVGSRQ